MSDIEVPIRSIGDVNVAIRSIVVGNLINPDACRKDVYDYGTVQRDQARAQLFSTDKLVIASEGEEIPLHSHDCSLVTFHCSYEMTLRVVRKELSMDNVNVFAGINDHKRTRSCFA